MGESESAAQTIAALSGAPIDPQPFEPRIHRIPRYLHAHLTGGRGFSSELTEEPSSMPSTSNAACAALSKA